jgi:hypothetical protein
MRDCRVGLKLDLDCCELVEKSLKVLTYIFSKLRYIKIGKYPWPYGVPLRAGTRVVRDRLDTRKEWER